MTDTTNENLQLDTPTDTVDGARPSNQQSAVTAAVDAAACDHEFKKPLLPSEVKPTKRKHKKHNSNGNTVISRDEAMILVPDGMQSTEAFTFIRTPKGSDNENSDTEVSCHMYSMWIFWFASILTDF